MKGERRHLTILFCDLVGSTKLAAQLDPEEWRATVAAYQRAATAAVTRFGGEVVRYVGDGIMAFFGYPVAHDNDAERAVRGGLAILDAIAQLNEPSAHTMLAVRIGIDSGPVVVGTGTGQAIDAFGDTANIAARVEGKADPGTLAISEATHRLISGLFIVEELGERELKGIDRPLQLYRVIRPSGVRGRLEAIAVSHGLTPFVGRDDELRSLMNRWQRVVEGEGQVVLIVGEAGIGKSRLVQHFHEQIAGTPHSWIEAGSAAFFQNTPFYAVIELLHQLMWEQNLDRLADYLGTMQSESFDAPREDQSSDGNHAGDQLARLQSELARAGLKPAEAIPLLAPLLGLPLTADYAPSSLGPEQQRRRLLAILVEWVLGAAAAHPLIIATEDLHWADPSTLELIQILVEQGAKTRLLLLYTARPEFRAPWPPRAHHTQINLSRLSLNNVRAMVEQVAARKAMTDETIATLIERTGGVPLFVEELTRALLESADAKLTGRSIPATLHDSLMARLDRLGPAKEVAQVGAVLGAEFSYELLHAVHPIAEENLQSALRNLADAELLYVRGIAPDATYQFKHALIRDAAYEALLKSRRKELHRMVAHTIGERFPAIEEAHPEVLALHWTEAGNIAKAVHFHKQAAEQATSRSAIIESESHLRDAIGLLMALRASPERDRMELELQTTLGAVLVWKSWGAPEREQPLRRAYELCERVADPQQILSALFQLDQFYIENMRAPEARELAERAVSLAQSTGEQMLESAAWHNLGETYFWPGDLQTTRNHAERAIALSGQIPPQKLIRSCGFDQWTVTAGILAWTDLILGRPDHGIQWERRLVERAGSSSHPFSKAVGMMFAGFSAQIRGDPNAAGAYANPARQVSDEYGFHEISAGAMHIAAWARFRQGARTSEIIEMKDATERLPTLGSFITLSWMLTLLAEAQVELGDWRAAETTCAQAFDLIKRTNEGWSQAELHRVAAMTIRAKPGGDLGAAEEQLHKAVELAQRQGSKWWELRATTSLARLLEQQGRQDEARMILAEIYGWFTEGFDTADLKDARALLDELNTTTDFDCSTRKR